MARSFRFRKRVSDRSGIDYLYNEIVNDNGVMVGPDEYDTPPPSDIPLGGEGDSSPSSDCRVNYTSYQVESANITQVQYLTTASTISVPIVYDKSGQRNYNQAIAYIAGSNSTINLSDNVGAKFNGTTGYLYSADSDDWNFGSGDFTIEFRVKFSAFPSSDNMNIIGQWSSTGDQRSWIVSLNDASGTKKIRWDYSTDGTSAKQSSVTSSSISVSLNTWYHIALVKNGSKIYYFLDGISAGSSTYSSSVFNSTSNINIGRNLYGVYLNGYLDEVRISKGIARWTSNFTPPTVDYYTNDSYVKLLLKLDKDSKDYSASNHTMSVSGGVTIDSARSATGGLEGDRFTLYCVGSNVTVSRGWGMSLIKPFTMDSGAMINFYYTTGANVWRETSRSHETKSLGEL